MDTSCPLVTSLASLTQSTKLDSNHLLAYLRLPPQRLGTFRKLHVDQELESSVYSKIRLSSSYHRQNKDDLGPARHMVSLRTRSTLSPRIFDASS